MGAVGGVRMPRTMNLGAVGAALGLLACGGHSGETSHRGGAGGGGAAGVTAGNGGSVSGASGTTGGTAAGLSGSTGIAGLGGSGGAAGSASMPIPIDQLPALLSSALCKDLGPCCARAGYTFNADACAAYEMELEASYAARDVTKIDYDPVAAGHCVAEVAQAVKTCGIADASSMLGSDCVRIFVGKLPQGAACANAAECAPVAGAFVICTAGSVGDPATCGVGPARVALGASCSETRTASGTTCGNGSGRRRRRTYHAGRLRRHGRHRVCAVRGRRADVRPAAHRRPGLRMRVCRRHVLRFHDGTMRRADGNRAVRPDRHRGVLADGVLRPKNEPLQREASRMAAPARTRQPAPMKAAATSGVCGLALLANQSLCEKKWP